jgi:hypothetical protein
MRAESGEMCELLHTSNHHYFDGNNNGVLYQCRASPCLFSPHVAAYPPGRVHRRRAFQRSLNRMPAQDEESGGAGGEARGGRGLGQMTRTHSLPLGRKEAAQRNGRPRLGVRLKAGAVMSRDSMTANHLEHEIATFPGSPGRGGRRRRR